MTAEELKQWRGKLGISRELASVALGVSRSTIARYEKDTQIPKYIALACKQILSEDEINHNLDKLCIEDFLDFAAGFKFTNLQKKALWLIFLDGLSKEQTIKQTGIDTKDLDRIYGQFDKEMHPPWQKGAKAYFDLRYKR